MSSENPYGIYKWNGYHENENFSHDFIYLKLIIFNDNYFNFVNINIKQA